MKKPKMSVGEVVSLEPHHSDRNHVRVRVAHGERKPKPKPKKGAGVDFPMGDYDDRATTEHVIPKDKARNFAIGDRVRSNLERVPDEDDEDDGPSIDEMKKSAASGLHRAGHASGKLGTGRG